MSCRALVYSCLFVCACAQPALQPPPASPQPSAATPRPSAAKSQPSADTSANATAAEVALVPIPNARRALPDVITGGKPSADNLREAKAAGFHTVISLLPETETQDEAAQARELGFAFVSIPVAGPSDLTEANARHLAEAMDAPGARPLILHCASGNRAGALLALSSYYVDHATPEAALELGERAGLKGLRDKVAAMLSTPPGN